MEKRPNISVNLPSQPEGISGDIPPIQPGEPEEPTPGLEKVEPEIPQLEMEPPKKPTEMEPPKVPQPEKTEETSKELQSALAQKEHFRKKYEKAKTELESKPTVNLPPSQNPMEVVKLAKALEGYNNDEIEFITKNASDNSINGVIEATKNEWVQSAIQARREKVAKEQAIPGPSGPSSGITEEKIDPTRTGPFRSTFKTPKHEVEKKMAKRFSKFWKGEMRREV
jgi:hypothetical protein